MAFRGFQRNARRRLHQRDMIRRRRGVTIGVRTLRERGGAVEVILLSDMRRIEQQAARKSHNKRHGPTPTAGAAYPRDCRHEASSDSPTVRSRSTIAGAADNRPSTSRSSWPSAKLMPGRQTRAADVASEDATLSVRDTVRAIAKACECRTHHGPPGKPSLTY